MGVGFWIFLIVVVGNFLINAMKKSAEAKRPRPQEPNPDGYTEVDQNPNKPVTFEDLLREIQASKNPPVAERKKFNKPEPRSYEVDYDEDIPEEEQDYETIPSYNNDDNRSNDVYEKAKKEAFSRSSLEETMKLSDTDMKFTHFKGYEEAKKPSVANDIMKDFNDPEGFKKAFIMSEILKRKF